MILVPIRKALGGDPIKGNCDVGDDSIDEERLFLLKQQINLLFQRINCIFAENT